MNIKQIEFTQKRDRTVRKKRLCKTGRRANRADIHHRLTWDFAKNIHLFPDKPNKKPYYSYHSNFLVSIFLSFNFVFSKNLFPKHVFRNIVIIKTQ